MLYPVHDAEGVLNFSQLKERGFWVELEHGELGEQITYPGPFIKTQEGLCRLRCRAPLIGEHNDDVYRREFGLSEEDMRGLAEKGVI
jgi:crotonobetainyl-CoA:carnitine CoA-transferase CaiB-like acyl-CoA transferase